MGTRNLTVVVKDKQVRVAQYCQWDGYLGGQGETAADFVARLDLKAFKQRVDQVIFIDEKDIDSYSSRNLVQKYSNDTLAHYFSKSHQANFERDLGAVVLDYVNETGIPVLINTFDFGYDSLFCEWAYVLDLDKKKFEVYKGFNKRKLAKTARWYKDAPDDNGYYGVRMLKSFPFKDFTNEVFENFVQEYNNKENEEYEEAE